ncbi:MAG: DUF494 domain-containing protein [Calditerrivibrio sp.]|nr:DUF494 domain-containing protein [Calditerrivibrio sp.]MCA1933527.1 DUF494 domain-containing protein [Calditerrivibrio sp.]MCA1980983.1 DUF494 domain-containing protein [Calditerrivibrio sp.]
MEKILVALNLIVDYIESEKDINQDEIEDMLYSIGLDYHEIRQAMTILDINSFDSVPRIRTFSKSELSKLSQQAVNFIQKLYIHGILDIDTIEDILEKCMEISGSKVVVEHIKQIVIVTLLEKKNFYFSETNSLEELS